MIKPIAAASLLMLAFVPGAAPAAAASPAPRRVVTTQVQAPRPDASFARLSARFIASLTRLSPVDATVLGEHRYDGRLPDVSAAGRALRNAEWRAILAAMSRINPARLARGNQVDYALLDNELRYRLWQSEVSQDWAWNPQIYNDIAAGSLYGLAARDFAGWDVRLKAATLRMEALPALLAQSRSELVPARVPEVFAQTVARQNSGIIEIAEGMLAPHADALTGADRARFDAALARLKLAVGEQQQWLDQVLVPAAKGEFRLGTKLYDEKMKFGLLSDITRPQLKALALKAKADTRAEMYALSRAVLADVAPPSLLPENPTAKQEQAVIESALSLSYAKHPARAQLEDRARETLAMATEFVRAKGFIRMADGPVKVITMPKFQQGNAVAYNDPPGPLERGQQNFYAVSPIPEEWSDAQATSFLSEYNDYMIHDLSIHEAMPGHYLQLDHSNRSPSILRAVLGSGPFVEGWAVYAEGVMKDEGYLGGDPQGQMLFQLTVLKMRLRSVTNTLLDIGIQTEGMTRDEAMELMQKGAFQQEREAAGKWVRANLSSVQLLSYFTGYEEHRSLRAEAEKRWGNSFSARRYHDAVLSFGSPPTKYVRELLFGLPVK
jgi:uncharacterized protein (DUF885 family)